MFRTIMTAGGVKQFMAGVKFELSNLDLTYFKEHYLHLTREQIEEKLIKELDKNFSLFPIPIKERNTITKLNFNLLKNEHVLEVMFCKISKEMGIKLIHQMDEAEFKLFINLTKKNFSLTNGGFAAITSKLILTRCKEEDINVFNIFRKELGLSKLTLDDIDYSSMDKWINEI